MAKEVYGASPKLPLAKAVKAGGMLYLSGAVGFDASGQVVGPDVVSQTKQTLENLKQVLESLGSSMDKVVKTTVFLTDVADFTAMNEVYASYFPKDAPPARSTIGVAALANPDLVVEIELIALP